MDKNIGGEIDGNERNNETKRKLRRCGVVCLESSNEMKKMKTSDIKRKEAIHFF